MTEVNNAQGMHAATAFPKKFEVTDNKGRWITVNGWLNLVTKMDVVIVYPFGKV
jgi:hypothetical protein